MGKKGYFIGDKDFEIGSLKDLPMFINIGTKDIPIITLTERDYEKFEKFLQACQGWMI